jgi:hypothetical protein
MAFSADDPGLGGWRNLGEEPIVETPWFRLRRARVELPGPGGRRLDHYLIRLPVLTMTAIVDAQDRVLPVFRHRFIPDTRGWELPSGIAELSADPADPADLAAIASRQALAESGWEAIEPKPMLTLQQNAGLTDSAVHIFLTRRAVHHGPPEADFEAERSNGSRWHRRPLSSPPVRSRTPAPPRPCSGCAPTRTLAADACQVHQSLPGAVPSRETDRPGKLLHRCLPEVVLATPLPRWCRSVLGSFPGSNYTREATV